MKNGELHQLLDAEITTRLEALGVPYSMKSHEPKTLETSLAFVDEDLLFRNVHKKREHGNKKVFGIIDLFGATISYPFTDTLECKSHDG